MVMDHTVAHEIERVCLSRPSGFYIMACMRAHACAVQRAHATCINAVMSHDTAAATSHHESFLPVKTQFCFFFNK